MHYSSPDAGDIEAPSIEQAAAWLMHRMAHALYGDGAIVRQFEAGGSAAGGEGITARAYIGAPVQGAGRLDFYAIEIYPVYLTNFNP